MIALEKFLYMSEFPYMSEETLITYDWGVTQASIANAHQRFSTTNLGILKFSSKTQTQINVSFLFFSFFSFLAFSITG